MKDKSSTISLIVHTKNEERNIKDCILSAKEIANEIIVIDQSSSDRTIEIAKSLGATIYSIPDKGFVDNFRNFGISKSQFKWILFLDADERLSKELSRRIKKIIRDNEYDVVIFPFKNIRLGKWMKHTGWWPDYHPRLFKRGYLRWPTDINQAHLQPVVKGRKLTLGAIEKNTILHYNVTNIQNLLSKLTKYYLLRSGGDYFKNRKITPIDLVNYYTQEFKWRYIDQQGYLDGMHGFIFSKFREYARFIEFVNWWEREGYPEIFNQEQLLELGSMEGGREELNMFKKSKIFRIWRFCCKYRELLKKKILG